MDTQRLILFVIFSFSALFLWEAWQREHRPPPPPAMQTAPAPSAESPVPTATPAPGAAVTANPNVAPAAAPAGEKIAIRTDLYSADIDTAGAVITQVALNEHRDTEDKSRPYLLLQKNGDRTFFAQSGLLGEGLPNHRTLWQALPGPRELAPGADTLELELQASAANGDKVVQTLTFHRGSYVIDVDYAVTNAGAAPIAPHAYFKSTPATRWKTHKNR